MHSSFKTQFFQAEPCLSFAVKPQLCAERRPDALAPAAAARGHNPSADQRIEKTSRSGWDGAPGAEDGRVSPEFIVRDVNALTVQDRQRVFQAIPGNRLFQIRKCATCLTEHFKERILRIGKDYSAGDIKKDRNYLLQLISDHTCNEMCCAGSCGRYSPIPHVIGHNAGFHSAATLPLIGLCLTGYHDSDCQKGGVCPCSRSERLPLPPPPFPVPRLSIPDFPGASREL